MVANCIASQIKCLALVPSHNTYHSLVYFTQISIQMLPRYSSSSLQLALQEATAQTNG